jgi:hypothetical protein
MLMGDTLFSEYSRLRFSGEVPDKVWLEFDGKVVDVSQSHWLLCIEPLVFGVWIGQGKTRDGVYRLRLGDSALVTVDLIHRVEEPEGVLLLLQVRHCQLFQLDPIRRWLLYYRYYSRDKLTYERFKGYVAAYTYPRRVRLVSFREGDHYNIFPMDLLGQAAGNRYVFGLRHTNLTLQRIMHSGKIVVSEVPAAYEDVIYKLGKHHSSHPPAPEELPFEVKCTREFGFYYPAWVHNYKEVRIRETFNMGSHMLLWGDIVRRDEINKGEDHSYLVHFLQYLHQVKKCRYPQS